MSTNLASMNPSTERPNSILGLNGLGAAQLMPPQNEQDQLVKSILETFEDVIYNRDTDDGAIDQASAIANRISDMMNTAGITSFAQTALMMMAERALNGRARDLLVDVVEELNERNQTRENRFANLAVDAMNDARALRRQQEEELEEHRRQQHTLGGVTMSGEEWSYLGNAMHNDEKVKAAMLAYLISQGLTPDEAERRRRLFTDATALMGKPKSQWTDADWDAFNRANQDPLYRGAFHAANHARNTARDIDSPEIQAARNRGSSHGAAADAELLASHGFSSRSLNINESGTDVPLAQSNRSTNSVAPMNSNAGVDCTASFVRAGNAQRPLDNPEYNDVKSSELEARTINFTQSNITHLKLETTMTGAL